MTNGSDARVDRLSLLTPDAGLAGDSKNGAVPFRLKVSLCTCDWCTAAAKVLACALQFGADTIEE
jgi:hypothetical protein